MKRYICRAGAALLLAAVLWLGCTVQSHASSYITAEGDTLSSIAELTCCDAELLAAVNGRAIDEALPAGLLLTLTDAPARSRTVEPGDTLWTLAQSCGSTAQTLAELNGIAPPYLIYPGDVLLLPLGEEQACVSQDGADDVLAAAAFAAARTEEQGLLWPVQGVITSPFGEREEGYHWGLDIAVSNGTEVLAAAAGTVAEAGWLSDGYGWGVRLAHGKGLTTVYGHCSEVLVSAGDRVERGEIIALSGSSGNSTGPHLHFEVRTEGEPEDPLDYLPADGLL